ncbi:hypothetical protein C9374_003112 [Naegleria lovaniensis]|uniref:Uncharacterized protein n=1 Tax=Naegleria lovaniensis TaxID=51637 RepID=A0AA88GTY1_NAELO|nr:uncharacterized protein C9374_003112 [Naegleria lovaniensis]KAG2385963.1 hypothetical protein C9374_003112 [Naegleria lovaniensis]
MSEPEDHVLVDDVERSSDLNEHVLTNTNEELLEFIRERLSEIGRSSTGLGVVFYKLNLGNLNLHSSMLSGHVKIAQHFPHLRNVDLSHNELTDLKFLSDMHSLVILNASSNKIKSLLDFHMDEHPSKVSLIEANFSNNLLTCFDRLMPFSKSLKRLNISKNNIDHDLEELNVLTHLMELDISNNRISSLNLSELKYLKILNAENNQLQSVSGIVCSSLQQLNLKNNNIQHLSQFQALTFVFKLNLENNKIERFEEVNYLADLTYMYDLSLLGNPFLISPTDDSLQVSTIYKNSILFRLPQIVILDQFEVSSEEKVRAMLFHQQQSLENKSE